MFSSGFPRFARRELVILRNILNNCTKGPILLLFDQLNYSAHLGLIVLAYGLRERTQCGVLGRFQGLQ